MKCIVLSKESCLDRCQNGFESQRKCQCDSMCKYYKSCCSDYEAVCGMTREYFFELDQKSVLPGYPKLIRDVWGISGPIDAAFTRINCQGKTYILKGNKYWRFDDGMLEDDYPRDISVGFDKIPDHVDAAFALPAHSHHGKEKVYFFKGDQYYVYEFLHQPSHEECADMSERSPSTLFRRYTDLYYSNNERFFSELFSD
ncbi:hypothetical protein GOODEAATRI_028478, partial [Goodea atripinnis]